MEKHNAQIWAKRFFWAIWLFAAIALFGWISQGLLLSFLANPYRASDGGSVTMDTALKLLLLIFSYGTITLPIVYGFMRPDHRYARVLKDSVWLAWMMCAAVLIWFVAYQFHPIHVIETNTDLHEKPDTTTSEFWWKEFFPYYCALALLTVIVLFPPAVYWVRRSSLKKDSR